MAIRISECSWGPHLTSLGGVKWLSAHLHIPSHARDYGNHRQGWSQETSGDEGPDRS